MKKYILTLLLAVFAGFINQAVAQNPPGLKPTPPVNPSVPNIWKFAGDIDTSRHSMASFTIGTKLYLIMGDTTSWLFRGRITAYTYEIDTVTKLITKRAPFPGKLRIGAVSFAIGNKGYVGGGRNFMRPDSLGNSYFKKGKDTLLSAIFAMDFKTWGPLDTVVELTNARGDSVLNDWWEYDPAGNTWTQKADMPGLKMGRAYGVGFAINNKGYVGLGYDNGRIKGEIDGVSASLIGPYIDSIVWNGAKWDTIMKGTAVITVDSIYTDSIYYLKDLWEYTPGSNTWAKKADFPGQPRAYASAFTSYPNREITGLEFFKRAYGDSSLYNAGFVGLGKGDSGIVTNNLYDDFYSYKPVTDSWKRIADFPASRRFGATGFGLGFLGYIVNGNDGLPRKDYYEYNSISNTWDRFPDLPDSARYLAAGWPVGRLVIYGTGVGVTRSYKNLFTWLLDTNRVYMGRVSKTEVAYNPFDTICAGSDFYINIKTPAGYVNGVTGFNAELSDTTGSFFYPIKFKTTSFVSALGSDSLTIKVTLPDSIASSDKYKLRVNTTAPNIFGNPTQKAFFFRRKPFITREPILDTVCLTTQAMFSIGTTLDTTFGDTAYYQWRKDGVNITNTAKYTGIHNDTLIINNAQLGDAGLYDVLVFGECGNATSIQARLVVQNIGPPTVTKPANDTVCVGASKTFTVVAAGNKLNYRWVKGLNDTLRNDPWLTGTATPSLTINPVRATDTGWYSAVVFEDCGARTVVDSIYLGIYDLTAIVEQPVNIDTVEFVNIGFKVKTKGKNLTYQWYKGTTPLSNGTKYDGADSDSLTIKNLVMSDVGFYQVEVTGLCGPPVKSLLGLLEVDPMPVILEQPINVSDCEGSTVFFSVKVDGANVQYQWRRGTTPLTNGGRYSGVNTRTLVISDIEASDIGADYNVIVSTGPYTQVISNSASLNVKPTPPKPVITPFGPNYLQVTPSNCVARWYKDNIFEPTLTGATVNVTLVGDYTVRITCDGCISQISDPYFWFPTVGITGVNAGSINLYPNPATNGVSVEIPANITSGTIKVYDLVGKVVKTEGFEKPGAHNLDIAKLEQGMYIVTVSSGDDTYVAKLIKQ